MKDFIEPEEGKKAEETGDLTEEEVTELEAGKDTKGLVTIKFRKPVTYNGEQIQELTFDFDSLTGADSMNIDEELTAMGKFILSPAFSGPYLDRMAAKACTLPIGIDLFRTLSIRDYNRIRNAARAFLLESE